MKIGIRNKFLFLFVVISVIPITAVSFITLERFQEEQTAKAVELEAEISKSAAKEIRDFLLLQFSFLGRAEVVFSEISEISGNSLLLERVLFSNDDFIELSAVGPSGLEFDKEHRALVFGPGDLTDKSEEAEFKKTKIAGQYIGPLRLVGGRSVFTIGKSVYDARRNFVGAIFAVVDARIMQDLVLRVSSSEDMGRAYVVDDVGVIVAHPDVSQILARKNFSGIAIVDEVLEKKEPISLGQSYTNDVGDEVVGAAFPVATATGKDLPASTERQWYVIAEQPAEVALAAVVRTTRFALWVLAIVVILAVLASLFITGRIVKPIKKLQRGAERIGAGSFGHTIDLKTKDELQDLAEAFNEMSENVLKAIEKERFLEGLKRDFVSVAAHQLRTPLSEIKWSLAAILENSGTEKLSEEHKKNLQMTFASTERMVALIDDLLNVSKIEEQKLSYLYEETDIEEIIRGIAENHMPSIKAKNLNLTFDFKKPLPKIKADSEKISIAFGNIFDNSVLYTPKGGSIRIKVFVENSGLVVMVEDNGLGIPKDQQKNIFQKFVRGTNIIKKTREGAAGGSGLGLYISKNIIEAHGGRIWFESEENKGSKFYFELPIN